MLELKTKKELATYAFRMASGSQLVRYRSTTYIPADYETLETAVVPDIDRTIWLPVSRADLRMLAADQYGVLFANDGELNSFDFMVAQSANQIEKNVTSLLVRTPQGLAELDDTGHLVKVTGDFRPNTLLPMLNPDDKVKSEVLHVIREWLNSDTEADALLSHLASSLAPGWSAVKYVLLLGDGRNGKSLLLKMLQSLFGAANVSSVTRQAMSLESPVVTELNGKLLNIVYDGAAEYVKNSSTEKSLVAGEPVSIRRLYESTGTVVQTNALFLEGLNREPKTHDKSAALQRRLVRFVFPNVYPLNHAFERHMLSEKILGAFLSLLIDYYVKEDDVAVRLAPTTQEIQLQLEQMYVNSLGLQFLKVVAERDALGMSSLIGEPLELLVEQFRSWRLKENDLGSWSDPDVQALFKPLVNTERKSVRDTTGVHKIRVVTSLKHEAAAFVDSLEGTEDEAHDDTVVADGPV